MSGEGFLHLFPHLYQSNFFLKKKNLINKLYVQKEREREREEEEQEEEEEEEEKRGKQKIACHCYLQRNNRLKLAHNTCNSNQG
jgi:hypothetical protein